jgi:hypothetical protein
MASGRRSLFLGCLLGGALIAGTGLVPVQAAVSKEAAAEQIAERYDVEVLRVRAGERDGRKVWLVTVMQPGGNRNNAFQVHVLAVDQESGELVSSFQHHADGYSLPPLPPGAERP